MLLSDMAQMTICGSDFAANRVRVGYSELTSMSGDGYHYDGQWHTSATVQVRDKNADGRPDVILSPSEPKGSFYRIS